MAISYLSKPIQPSPYVIPLDLNILAKVNQYKESEFYKNFNTLKQYYGQLKNTDILNKEAKDRFDRGYNEAMRQIDSLGSMDYSNMGVVNQLEGLGSQLYDDITLNAIAATKSIRERNKKWEEIKMNPKLSKYYAPINQAYDSRYDNEYINGRADAIYNGTSTPTLYSGNVFEKLTEGLKNLPKNVVTAITNSGSPYYFNKETSEFLSDPQIQSYMKGMLSPDVLEQIKINTWGSMNGMSNEDLTKKYIANYDKDMLGINTYIDDVNKKIASLPDGKEKDFYNQQLIDLQKQKIDIQSSHNIKGFVEGLQDPERRIGLISQFGMRELFENGMKSWDAKKIKNDLIQNREQDAIDRRELEDIRFKNRAKLLETAHGYKMEEIDQQGKYRNSKNPKNPKNPNDPNDPNDPTEVYALATNTNVTKSQNDYTLEGLRNFEAVENKSINDRLKQFFLDTAPDPNGTYATMTEAAFKDHLVKIAQMDGDKANLSVEDVRMYVVDKNINAANREFYEAFLRNYDAASKGDRSAMEGITDIQKDDFLNLHNSIVLSKGAVEARKLMLKDAEEKAIKEFKETKDFKKLKPHEKVVFEAYLRNPTPFITGKFESAKYGTVYITTEQLDDILSFSKMNMMPILNPLDEKIKKILKTNTDFIKNYYTRMLDNNSFKKDQRSISLVKTLINQTYPTDADNIDMNKITLMGITQMDEGEQEKSPIKGAKWKMDVQVTLGSETDGKTPTKTVYLTDDQAIKFGAFENPYYELDNILRYRGNTENIFADARLTKDQETSFGSGVFKYKLMKPTGVGGNVKIAVTDDDDKIIYISKMRGADGQIYSFQNAL